MLKFMDCVCSRHALTLLVASFLAVSDARAVDLTEGFDDITDLPAKGWSLQNLSSPLGVINWFQGNPLEFNAYAGPSDSYLGANYNNTSGAGTISNWAITPERIYSDGDTFTFYTRTANGSTYADRLQVRLSTNGASSDVGSTAMSVGDFSTLLLDINPTLIGNGYPDDWTQFVVTLSGLGGPTSGRIAFRYFVTSGGPNAANSNYIGIDSLTITNSVPEPSTYALAILGIGVLGFAGRRGNRART